MTSDRPVYQLLPAIHRIRDDDHGQPLAALLDIVEDELLRLTGGIDQLYDDWFIETCQEWLVPYLGDLLGVQGLRQLPPGVASLRAFIANTLRYRRRKGTAAVLEQVARDVTGWPARAVEYFQLLSTTQHLDHVRLGAASTVDIRDGDRMELLDSPFGREAHSVEARSISTGQGRYNIPNIGLHLWRIGAYQLTEVDARAADPDRGRWRFDPAGRDLALFNQPQTKTSVTQLAKEGNVPTPLRRRALERELGPNPPGTVSVPVVKLDGGPKDIKLCCRDLSSDQDGNWPQPLAPSDEVWVDPVLGRLALPAGEQPARVQVSFAYGFPGDVGAGPYDRRGTMADAMPSAGAPEKRWQRAVSSTDSTVPGKTVRTIPDALREWNNSGKQFGFIVITDSATYEGDLKVVVPAGCRLCIVAATLPKGETAGTSVQDVFMASGPRPHVIGNVTVSTTTPTSGSAMTTELIIGGLSIEGGITVSDSNGGLSIEGGSTVVNSAGRSANPKSDLTSLVLANVTLLPGVGKTGVEPQASGGWITSIRNQNLTIRLLRSICAGVDSATLSGLNLTNSIAYANDGVGTLVVQDARVELAASTILGATIARSLTASNTIMSGLVTVTERQRGYARFSYLPWESSAPRRYRCQPAAESESGVAPVFVSTVPGNPAFCQLSRACPQVILTGADDEGELGVYHELLQQQRIANLLSQLDNYLRFGLEAGVFFET